MIGNRKEMQPLAKIYYLLNCNKTYPNWRLESASNIPVRVSQFYTISDAIEGGCVDIAINANSNRRRRSLRSQSMICVRLARTTHFGHSVNSPLPRSIRIYDALYELNASTITSLSRLIYVRFSIHKGQNNFNSKI